MALAIRNLTSLGHALFLVGVATVGIGDAWALTGDMVSRRSDGSPPSSIGITDYMPAVTPDGRYVAFMASATDLVSPDASGSQIYLRDRSWGHGTDQRRQRRESRKQQQRREPRHFVGWMQGGLFLLLHQLCDRRHEWRAGCVRSQSLSRPAQHFRREREFRWPAGKWRKRSGKNIGERPLRRFCFACDQPGSAPWHLHRGHALRAGSADRHHERAGHVCRWLCDQGDRRL